MSYLDNLFQLQNKTAAVIGGTGELCGAMAEGLAAAGVHTVLIGRNAEKAAARLEKISTAGGAGSFVAADATSRESLVQARDQILKEQGGIDILVNGAGVNSPTPFLEIQEEEFDHILAANTKAVVLSCQVFGEHFLDAKLGASIINVGSMSGLRPLSRVFTYSMSKAAVHNLSANLAREWAPHGIRVNTIVPGFFPAEQNKRVLDESRVECIMRQTPMDRFGEAKELIGATLLLASDGAGGFITGSELVVDGGFSVMSI